MNPLTAASRMKTRTSTVRRAGARVELAAEGLDLVAELRCVLEAQLLGGREHLFLEGDQEPVELVGRQALDLRWPRRRLPGTVGDSRERNSAMSETPLTIDSGVIPCSSL